jgi:hypothetical protein
MFRYSTRFCVAFRITDKQLYIVLYIECYWDRCTVLERGKGLVRWESGVAGSVGDCREFRSGSVFLRCKEDEAVVAGPMVLRKQQQWRSSISFSFKTVMRKTGTLRKEDDTNINWSCSLCCSMQATCRQPSIHSYVQSLPLAIPPPLLGAPTCNLHTFAEVLWSSTTTRTCFLWLYTIDIFTFATLVTVIFSKTCCSQLTYVPPGSNGLVLCGVAPSNRFFMICSCSPNLYVGRTINLNLIYTDCL